MMDKIIKAQFCSRCCQPGTTEEICPGCISELLETYDYNIGWKMALEIEKEQKELKNLTIEIQ
jgi:hypothetical protein